MLQDFPRALRFREWAVRLALASAAYALVGVVAAAEAQESGSDATLEPAAEKPSERSATGADEAPKVHKPELHFMKDRLTLREPFNQASEGIRVLAFLSPSCSRCLKNAGQLQKHVLEAYPDADIATFVVWMFVRNDDSEDAAVEAMKRIPDPRVRHYWDPDRRLIHQVRDAIMFDVNMRVYDIFMLYGREAAWEKRVPRPDYWMHEFTGIDGPWWNVQKFASEVAKGLEGEPFDDPWN